MSRTYVIIVNCGDPIDAELLKHQNGENKTWLTLVDAQEVVDKINSNEGQGSARAVVL